MEPEPYSLQGQRCVVADGSSFCMDLHQWRYVDHNTVHWQLLGPFVSIWGGSGSPVDVHQILRLSRLALSALLAHLDMDYERVIHPSKRAVRAAMAVGGARIATEFTRDSWTINTEGLLLVLGHFAPLTGRHAIAFVQRQLCQRGAARWSIGQLPTTSGMRPCRELTVCALTCVAILVFVLS